MTTTMKQLAAEAARCGVTLALAHLEPPLRGHYDATRAEIIVDIKLTLAETKEALAHELGHAHYGDRCSDGPLERRAWRRAAALLVDVDEYRHAEAIEPDPEFIADELGVTRRIVRVFQKEHLPKLSLRHGT